MKYAFEVDRLKQGLYFIFGQIKEEDFEPEDGIQDIAFKNVYVGKIWEEDSQEWWYPESGSQHGPGIIITIDPTNTGTDKIEVGKRFLKNLFSA